MSLILCRLSLRSIFKGINHRNNSGYVVLLPEIASNIPKQNPLLKDGLPNFEEIDAESCFNILGKSLLDFEHEVFSVEAQLKASDTDSKEKVDYSNSFMRNVVQPLQKPGIFLDTSWGIAKTLFIVDDKKIPGDKYLSLHSRAHKAQYARFSNQTIYESSKKCDLSQLSEEEQRVVERYQLEGNLNGLGLSLSDQEILEHINKSLYLEKSDFNKKIHIARSLIKIKVSDKYVVQRFPVRLVENMASDRNDPTAGPWIAPLDDYYFNKFMEYCPDDKMRNVLWENKVKIASMLFIESELQNSVSLEIIRDCRKSQAELLGFPNYATMSMETKMSGTLDNTLSVLESLRESAFKVQKDELNHLEKFAKESGFKGQIDIPHIPYWARKQKQSLFNFENEELRDYFPFDKVFAGLTEFCEKTFGIRFELKENVSAWHPDVKYYNVYEEDSAGPVAGFYFDPFFRLEKLKSAPEEGWVVGIRSAYQIDGPRSIPLYSLIMNLPQPIYGKPSLLSYSEVQGLFSQFGRLLQQLLCTVSYTEVSGTSYNEWDAVDIPSHFLCYCLQDPKLLESISGHYSTDEKLPVTNMKDVSAHMAGTILCSELFKSVLDLQLNYDKRFWRDIVRELWPKYFTVPFPEYYQEVLSMSDIVTGQCVTSYYSHIWSKMIAADAYSSFEEENADHAAIGSRFRDTYLAFGGSCDPHEVFRRFRGRDPTPDSYLRYLKLK